MTSKIKVDNINKVSDDSNIIKKCGTTTTIGSGASNPIVVDGSAVTLGRCGGTVALASGATQTGFGRTGTVDWQTGSIKTSTFTAANGEGYFANTTGSAFVMNLPAGSAGAIVAVSDYLRTFSSNNLTVTPNGSEKIGGTNGSVVLDIEGQAATFVYVDGTSGWINVQNAEDTEAAGNFITATGGSIATVDTNFKVHTFTGPGTFCISAGSGPQAKVDYLVIAGGGGGANNRGGGGGAGGFRESHTDAVSGPYTASPLASAVPLGPFSPGPISVTVGGGATGVPGCTPNVPGNAGSVSTFSTITSAGGGGGGYSPNPSPGAGLDGGSGGGGGYPDKAGGSGNTPSVSPPQGRDGGTSSSSNSGSGGGGAGATGGASSNCTAGSGGAGLTTSITGSAVQRGGGGGGSGNSAGGCAGAGGGGTGFVGGGGSNPSDDATVNTGGGGGAARGAPAGSGGSGIVVIRYKFQ